MPQPCSAAASARTISGPPSDPLGITASRLKTLGLIDRVVAEPTGGAHRDHPAMMVTLKKALGETLRDLQDRPLEQLIEARQEKLLAYGRFKELAQG